MSFSARLKERRESLGLSRIDLARKLGITASAIANYENAVSAPKTELLYILFDALQCDANYLYQDVIRMDTQFTASLTEWDILHKYRELDCRGREIVDMVLDKEHEQTVALRDGNLAEGASALQAGAVALDDMKAAPSKEEGGYHSYEVAARSKEGTAKSFHPHKDFDPTSIHNEGDF